MKNKNKDKVIKIYNGGQEKYRFEFTLDNELLLTHAVNGVGVLIEVYKQYTIGFYEWLCNEKYGVFETFDIMESDLIHIFSGLNPVRFKPVPEIINYLANQIKEG